VGLIPEDLSMCSTLDLEDLFTRECLAVRRIVLLDLCPVLYQRLVFLLNRPFPLLPLTAVLSFL